jgi:hypothetical protein
MKVSGSPASYMKVIDWVNNPQFRALCLFVAIQNLKGDLLGLAESQQTALF